MQNLIPGVSWGKKMNAKQFDRMYQRMLDREKKKNQDIQRQIDLKKDDDLVNCTFRPKTNHARRKAKPKLGVSVPRMNPKTSDQADNSGAKANQSVGKDPKKGSKNGDQKFLARLEEMKRRDQLRKERTRKKYQEKKKKEFRENCTFQPNKLRKKHHSRDSRGGSRRAERDAPGQDSHLRQESENVVGKSNSKKRIWIDSINWELLE